MEEKIVHLDDRYCLHEHTWTPITVRIQRWYYRGPRIKLTIVEGYHETSEEIDNALGEYGKNPDFPNYPKHLEIVCHPEDMQNIAKALTEICKPDK